MGRGRKRPPTKATVPDSSRPEEGCFSCQPRRGGREEGDTQAHGLTRDEMWNCAVRSCPLSGISKSKSEIPSALPFCDEGTLSFSWLPTRTCRPHPGSSSLGVICGSLYPSSARGRASLSPGQRSPGGLVWGMAVWAASPSQSAASWERLPDHTPS